jgi:hypothetical protein
MTISSLRNGRKVDRNNYARFSDSQTSTNAALMLARFIPFAAYALGLVELEETGGANGVTCKIYGIQKDDSTPHLLKTSILAAGAQTYETITDAWAILYVTIDSTVDNSHGVVKANWCLKR